MRRADKTKTAKKLRHRKNSAVNILRSSDSACNFAGTKATSTCINSLGRAVHYSLDPFNVGLPGSV